MSGDGPQATSLVSEWTAVGVIWLAAPWPSVAAQGRYSSGGPVGNGCNCSVSVVSGTGSSGNGSISASKM
jgi:hypothetical protein